jgi:PEP-CTERM putative exosortase interaction domain
MKKTILAFMMLVCTVKGFGQGINFPIPLGPLVPLNPLFDEGASVIPLDGAHANPPNDNWFRGIATLQLQGNRLNYYVKTTGPFRGAEEWRSQPPSVRIEGISTAFELPMFLTGFSDPNYDLIVYLPGQAVPSEDVYRIFLSGSSTLTDLQLDDLLSRQSLLTVDFGEYGSIAGQISVIPEPSVYALLFGSAAAMGCSIRRRNKARDNGPTSRMQRTRR